MFQRLRLGVIEDSSRAGGVRQLRLEFAFLMSVAALLAQAHGQRKSKLVQSKSRENADRGGQPDEGGGREVFCMVAVVDDESRAQKADAHDNVGNHAKGAVRGDGVGYGAERRGRDVGEHKPDHGEDRGASGYEHLGADAGFLADELAFDAEDRAEGECGCEPDEHLFKTQHCINISIPMLKDRVFIGDLPAHVGKTVKIMGWVDIRRDQGKLVFFDFRDMTGYIQGVILPNANEAHVAAEKIRPEWVLAVTGKVDKRPEKNIQKDKQNGDLELEILSIEVLNESETPPFDVGGDGKDINEEIRLKYRYLDLRRPRLQRNIRMRDTIIAFFRDYMHKNHFVEIETPMLMKGTPEGSREYLVPSRLERGKFYALPQSPQQFKQLSMVAGFERYFQIARCMRDEDLRGDRQPGIHPA